MMIKSANMIYGMFGEVDESGGSGILLPALLL
jgi:hypothetical protein